MTTSPASGDSLPGSQEGINGGDPRMVLWPLPALSPTLTSEFSLVAQRPARRHTQDMAWLTSAISVGTAAGPAAAGGASTP